MSAAPSFSLSVGLQPDAIRFGAWYTGIVKHGNDILAVCQYRSGYNYSITVQTLTSTRQVIYRKSLKVVNKTVRIHDTSTRCTAEWPTAPLYVERYRTALIVKKNRKQVKQVAVSKK